MKLPSDATIAPEKFTEYLLLPQQRSDKSRFLARAGYGLGNVQQLIADLRAQHLAVDASLSRSTSFGDTYIIDAPLCGPNGHVLSVRTVWLRNPLSGAVHFVTLLPHRPPNP